MTDVAEKARLRPLPTPTTVERVQQLSRSMLRVHLVSDDWSGFGDPTHADSYVKLVFLAEGVDYTRPIDPARIRAEAPAEHWPRLRTYTVRAFDRAAGRLTLDVVVHGAGSDSGLAARWAAKARPGDEIHLLGPGGGYSPDPRADWHLLVGDESALPAIAVALEQITSAGPVRVPVSVFVEVDGAEDEIALPSPAGVEVNWLHRDDAPLGDALVDAVTRWRQPAGTGQAFVHGEAGFVRTLRRHLRIDRGLPLSALSISGYWRRGADDEAWREVKRAWNAAIEAAESDAGA